MRNFGFRGFNPKDVEMPELPKNVVSGLTDDDTKEENHLLNHIFAPNPLTGNPDASLPLLADEDSDIGRFIRDHFMRGVSTSRGVDDPDLALELAQGAYETNEQYVNRVRSFMKDRYLKKHEE